MKQIILFTLLLLTYSCSESNNKPKESYVKSLLPGTATEVQEYYLDQGFSGDYTRLLKAKVTKEDYESYALKLNLTEKYSDYLKTNRPRRSIKSPNLPKWWDEPEGTNDFYYILDHQKEYERRLKWKNGWLYLATEAW